MSALQFLLLEANLADAEVVQATLREGGIECELLRVETRADFIRTLESNAIDLILADYGLSNFDDIAALTIARRLRPEIPFIFISGSLGEELAIAAIKQGATDYILKQRLGRLVPSVQEALQEVAVDKDTTKRKQALLAIESDLKDTQLLHELSTRLVTEGDIQTLYQEIIAAAIALTRADAGSIQILDEATQDLVLLATQGITPAMLEHFYRVNADSNTPCGMALTTGDRAFVDFDVPESEDPDGSMRLHIEAGLFSAQSTPLITRSGKAIGMFSTHWCKHHRPTERELRFLDLLARQAAGLIEQRQAEAAIAADLRDTQRLHKLSTSLASEDNIQVLYDEIVAAAVDLMQADAGTIQILEEEAKYIILLASLGLEQKTVEYFYRIDANSNTACGIALATRKRAMINYDVPASEDPSGSLQKLVKAGFLCGQSTPLITRSGRAIGMVSTHWGKHHRPTERELRFLDLLARQATDLIEQRQAQVALRESEAKYRSLFESMEEGFYSVEVLYDEDGQPVDHRILEANPAFERHTGLTNARGRLASELMPIIKQFWSNHYARVVATGESERLEQYSFALNRWFNVEVSRIGDESLHHVAIIFQDVTDRKRAEAALRESEEKFRTFVSATSDIIYEMSADWREMHSLGSKEFVATTEEPRRDWTEKYIPETDKPRVRAAINRAIATRSNFELEHRVIRLDGTVGWTFSRAIPLIDEAGVIVKWFGAASDITERVEAEAALRESEEKYRSLFESMNEGLAINELVRDESGRAVDARYLELNPAYQRQTGSDRSSTLGRLASEVFPNYYRSWLEIVERVVRTGQPERFEHFVPDNDKWFVFQVTPFGGADGFTVLYDDITDRKHAEEQLRRAAEMDAFRVKLSDALRSLSDPVDIQGNAMRLLRQHFDVGWCYYGEIDEAGTIVTILRDAVKEGLPSLVGVHDISDIPEFTNFLRAGNVFNAPDISTFRLFNRRVGEQYNAIGLQSIVGVPLVKNGRLIAFLLMADTSIHEWSDDAIALLEDVAERTWAALERARAEAALRESEIGRVREQSAREQERQRAEALAELDHAKTLFFSNVSHEFRTPLTLSLAPLQDALSDSVNPLTSSQRERLELAHRNSLRLLKLVNTLLDFSRIEADRLKANYEPTDLSSYTAELASVFRSAMENANLQLVIDCPPLPNPIYVDREMWEKIVLNLLSNAFKFTFEGIISVSLKPVQEGAGSREQGAGEKNFPPCPPHPAPCLFVELIVSDTGVGISASELPHLFERFYQVRGAKGRSYEGSGIGLSLVQELVKRHGGAIAVTSAVGQGTTFTVTIPTGTAHLPADQIEVASTLVSTAVTANAFVEEALRWLPEEEEGGRGQGAGCRRQEAGGTAFDESTELQLQSSEVQARNSEVQARNSEVHAQNSEVQARNSEVHAQNSEVQARNSEVQARNSEVHARNSEVQARNSEVHARNSEVHAQSSEVHAQNSEVQAQSSEVHVQNSKRARILLVDDNADMRGYLRRLLNQYYEVEVVNDGLAALNAIRSGEGVIYDLVLADVMMPRMDGFELLRSLRASPNTQTIPIILLSARAGEESRVQGLETGADDYLIKPFSARELLARVNANLQLAQLRREAVYREQVMQAVQTLNNRLEQQVEARTAQLEAINQELEAFSSSVSHDLRTPLRYISSFAEQLQGKLNAATLVDTSSLQSIKIITKSALEAEKMVDNLLEFSRLGKTEIHLITVNISQLIQQVREQLQPELVGRSLHWEIEPLATVEADPVLLRLVLQNLLSNAVKYTRNNTEAVIKIGRVEQEQEVIFFVKDNGAGFDMKYCDRLFSIFQRLHPQEEFPGTGVGLATVRRIIHRHGGRIWAEGAINQGATFYFSLPKHEAE